MATGIILQIQEGVEAGRIIYDEKKARQCLDETFADTSCSAIDFFGGNNDDDDDTNCDGTFTGIL